MTTIYIKSSTELLRSGNDSVIFYNKVFGNNIHLFAKYSGKNEGNEKVFLYSFNPLTLRRRNAHIYVLPVFFDFCNF